MYLLKTSLKKQNQHASFSHQTPQYSRKVPYVQQSSTLWGGGGGEVYSSCMAVVVYDHRPSRPCNAGTENVGFSPTRQTSLGRSAKRREVFGESHEG